jgi:hypothetical protein
MRHGLVAVTATDAAPVAAGAPVVCAPARGDRGVDIAAAGSPCAPALPAHRRGADRALPPHAIAIALRTRVQGSRIAGIAVAVIARAESVATARSTARRGARANPTFDDRVSGSAS